MQNFTLANKQALQSFLTTNNKQVYYLEYDPTQPNTSTLESNAVAAGYTQYYREATTNLVEVIYTK